MSYQEQVPPQQAALNALRQAEGIGPLKQPDQEAFDGLQHELDQERAEALGGLTAKKLVEVDGVVVPEDEVAASRSRGEDVSIHAVGGRVVN